MVLLTTTGSCCYSAGGGPFIEGRAVKPFCAIIVLTGARCTGQNYPLK